MPDFRKFVEALGSFIPDNVFGVQNGSMTSARTGMLCLEAQNTRSYDDVKAELLVAQTNLAKALKICEHILEASIKVEDLGPRIKLALEDLSTAKQAGEELKDLSTLGFAFKFKKVRSSEEPLRENIGEELTKKCIGITEGLIADARFIALIRRHQEKEH